MAATRLGQHHVAFVLRLALGGLFAYAGALKLGEVHALADDIANYHLLPGALVPLAAAVVPSIELVVATALLLGLWTRGAALVTAGMMAAFTFALLQAFARDIDLRCGCFGGEALADWTTVVRDLALLGAAVHVFVFDKGFLSVASLLRKETAAAAGA